MAPPWLADAAPSLNAHPSCSPFLDGQPSSSPSLLSAASSASPELLGAGELCAPPLPPAENGGTGERVATSCSDTVLSPICDRVADSAASCEEGRYPVARLSASEEPLRRDTGRSSVGAGFTAPWQMTTKLMRQMTTKLIATTKIKHSSGRHGSVPQRTRFDVPLHSGGARVGTLSGTMSVQWGAGTSQRTARNLARNVKEVVRGMARGSGGTSPSACSTPAQRHSAPPPRAFGFRARVGTDTLLARDGDASEMPGPPLLASIESTNDFAGGLARVAAADEDFGVCLEDSAPPPRPLAPAHSQDSTCGASLGTSRV